MQPQYDVICCGRTGVDILFYAMPKVPVIGQEVYSDRYAVDVGGGAAITAVGLRKLGLRAAVISSVGDDMFGTFARDKLQSCGVGIECLRTVPAPTSISAEMSFPLDRATVTVDVPEHRLTAEAAIRNLVRRGKHLHVVGVLDAFTRELLRAASGYGLTTSVDANLLIHWRVLQPVLSYVDFLLPKSSEVDGVFRGADIRTTARLMARRLHKDGCCVIRLGAKGALCTDGDRIVECPAFPATVLDTTGAGNAFNAAFLCGYFRGLAIPECVRLGNAMGSLKVQREGGVAGMPNSKELSALLRDQCPSLERRAFSETPPPLMASATHSGPQLRKKRQKGVG